MKPKPIKREEARERQARRDKRGDAGQIAHLDQHGFRAKRERAKLAKRQR